MKPRFYLASIVAASMLASGAASAQDLLLQINRETGDLSLTGAGATVVDLAGYTIESDRSTLAGFANYNGIGDEAAESGWEISGPTSAGFLAELNTEGNNLTSLNDTISFDLGSAIYDPTAAQLAAGFGVDVEQDDFTVTYVDGTLNEIRSGVVEFVGEQTFNSIGITIDLSDGSAIVENESPFNDLVVTGFLIEAATEDTLNTAGTFTGLTGFGGFQNGASPDGENLSSTDPTGAGFELDSGQSQAIGIVGGLEGDISFSFILAGTDESPRTGFVKFIGAAGLPGDYDGSGFVDAADYTIYRDSVGAAEDILGGNGDGSGTVDDGDLEVWQNAFGTGTLPAFASAAVVPEPTGCIIVMLGAACVFGTRRSAPKMLNA